MNQIAFEVYYNTRDTTGRTNRVVMLANSFDDCLQKAEALYGKKLKKIVFDSRKNYEGVEKVC